MGSIGALNVAIKKMRAGLIDKNGFESFSKEVSLEHEARSNPLNHVEWHAA